MSESHSPHEKICIKCGSAYWITSSHIPDRDKDTITCEICGEILVEWNEARIFEAKLIRRSDYKMQ